MLIDMTRLSGVSCLFNYTGNPAIVYDNPCAIINDDNPAGAGLYRGGEVGYNVIITLAELTTLRRVIIDYAYIRNNTRAGSEADIYVDILSGGGYTTIWSETDTDYGNKQKIISGIWADVSAVRVRANFTGQKSSGIAGGQSTYFGHYIYNIQALAIYEPSEDFYDSGVRLQERGGAVRLAVREPAAAGETLAIQTDEGAKRFALVLPSSPAASRVRVMTAAGVRAIAKII